MEQPKTTCAANGCKSPPTEGKKKCSKCHHKQRNVQAFMDLGIDQDNASALVAVKGTKCLSCKECLGISFVQGSTPTIMCIACMIGKMQPAGSVAPAAPVVTTTAAPTLVDHMCKTCDGVFMPAYPKQVYCTPCSDAFKAFKAAKTPVVNGDHMCKTCNDVFTLEYPKQVFCTPCSDAFKTAKK